MLSNNLVNEATRNTSVSHAVNHIRDSNVVVFPIGSNNIVSASSHNQRKQRPVVRQTSDPIKDEKTLIEIEKCLKSNGKYGERNWLIFVLGIHLGRRCGDILNLKIKDVYDGYKVREDLFFIREEKTEKVAQLGFCDSVVQAITNYLSSFKQLDMDGYLFPSQKGGSLSRKSYWRIMKGIQKELDLNFHFSTHSMRKTWAYTLYQEYKDVKFVGGADIVDRLQFMLNHSSRLMTLRYIGINDESIHQVYKNHTIGLVKELFPVEQQV